MVRGLLKLPLALGVGLLPIFCSNGDDQSRLKSSISQEPRPVSTSEFSCSNTNVIWRFLKSGAIECKKDLTLNFTDDATGKPLIGALYRLYLDVYLQVPIKQFFSSRDVALRTVTLPPHTVFARVQLADDPDNKKPIYGVAKVLPKVTYTLSGLCDVKLKDFSVQVEEVKAPDLGKLTPRVGKITESIVEYYKEEAMAEIQSQLDSVRHNRLCWAYRKVFYRNTADTGLDAIAPQGAEKEVADAILNGGRAPAAGEKSEVDEWTKEKYAEFERQWSCRWAGQCE